MARTLNANQTVKVDRPYVQPIYLVHLILSGLTLYFSDRNYYYNSINYEDYLFDVSDIESQVRNLGGYDNPRVTLRFKNDPIRDKNTLIELFDTYPPEKKYVEIYKLYIDTGETFGSDVSTKIFKGEMGQPYEITDPAVDFKIDCSFMLFGKNASLPLDVIDLADFANADPDDVGKYRNILYGSLKKVVCPWTVAGWLSTLTADITSAATSITVTDGSGCPATPFTSLCDSEEIRVTSRSGNDLTVTRGYGGTTAVAHNKGAEIYEKRADFEAEVAKHPVKAINDIFVRRGDKEWLRVVSGATKYISSGGRAYIVFSDKVKFEEKPNQTVSTGTHIHSITGSGTSLKTCIPTGALGGTNPTNAIDGSEESYASLGASVNCTASFTETNLGTVTKTIIHMMAVGGGTVWLGNIQSWSISFSTASWKRFTYAGGDWSTTIGFTADGSGATLYEMYKEIEYTPGGYDADTHAADGVALSGNSVANMIIGDIVAADVDGYQDDGSGTYTGVANALIERPDHVRKHILIALLGFASGDIGASFATVGTIYGSQISGGYKFAFNLPEVSTETADLFEKMDLHSRSNMFESQGKFQLAFGSTSDPTSQKTFDHDNVRGSFLFSKTDVADIRNKIRGHYLRDYSRSGALGEKYQKVTELSDAGSITKYGEMQEDIEFSCIGDLALMVDDVMDWILLESHELKKIVEFEAFWDALLLENCDYFTVTSNFWSGLKFRTILFKPTAGEKIEIKGLQFVSS